jgi:DNA-binding response OmpR family regulator
MDIMLDDPYVSRDHCVLIRADGHVQVVTTRGRNHILVSGREVDAAMLAPGEAFIVGQTTVRVRRVVGNEDDETLPLGQDHTLLTLRRSTRELVTCDGALIAQFSASEFSVFELLARCYPDAASHARVGEAVWRDVGYDQYQIHRLIQRIRRRLGDWEGLLENVRGAGYRLRRPVDAG